MKKLAIILSLIAMGGASVMAQGKFSFATTGQFPLTVTDQTTTNTVGSSSAGYATQLAGQVRVALFVGANGAPASSMVFAGMTTNSPATTGVFVGTFNGGGSFVLPAPFDGSGPIEFQVFAWSISTGALDYQSALNAAAGYVGATPIIQGYSPAQGAGIVPASFGTAANQARGLLLVPVPEPTTLVLGGIGAAALLLFRRRK